MAFAPALIAYRTIAPAAIIGIIGSAAIERIRRFLQCGERRRSSLTELARKLLRE
jgi:hypothetical protein